jgi:hypothetical protein
LKRILRVPSPPFSHLLALSDGVGVFEHALYTAPRVEHGYCTDDVARALVVVARESYRSGKLEHLTEICLAFIENAQLPDGGFYNRLSAQTGAWTEVGSHDADGRALYGLGVASALPGMWGRRALTSFEKAAGFDSTAPRSNAWAVLGACEVLASRPSDRSADMLLRRACERLGRLSPDPRWPWPESHLAYDNARLAHARIAAGMTLEDSALIDEGIALLEWLVSVELRGGHFSFVPAGGLRPGDAQPGFDQQPIEAGSMADACAAAFDATGDSYWGELTILAAEWFLGRNDTGVALLDPVSGGCCDGLTETGRNENQGAESTLALIGAFQQAARAQAARRSASSSSSVETSAAPTLLSAAPYVR